MVEKVREDRIHHSNKPLKHHTNYYKKSLTSKTRKKHKTLHSNQPSRHHMSKHELLIKPGNDNGRHSERRQIRNPPNTTTYPGQRSPTSRAAGLSLPLRLHQCNYVVRKGKPFEVKVILRVSYLSLFP